MASLGKAFTYVIAAQFQAIGLLLTAWWIGAWLDREHATSFSWMIVTMPVGILVMGQTFYVMVRRAYQLTKSEPSGTDAPQGGRKK
jgi:hypothetical protein